MFPATFTLLQNEGYLMQGCFKSSLSDLLAITSAQPGPYRVYEKDYPNVEPIVTKPDAPEDSMSTPELARHNVIIAAARRHICWRLVHLLVPLKELLIAISQEIRQDDFKIGGEDTDPSIPPNLEEFLDFVCGDKPSSSNPRTGRRQRQPPRTRIGKKATGRVQLLLEWN